MDFTPRLRRHSRACAGFTLLEMVLAITIIGVIVVGALPAIQKVRKAANVGHAKNAANLLRQTESDWAATHGTYGTLAELYAGGVLDAAAASGRQFGYAFVVELSTDRQHFRITGAPAAPGRSGDQTFSIDDTGAPAQVACAPGQQIDPAGACAPEDGYAEFVALLTLRGINQLSGGAALPIVKALAAAGGTLLQSGAAFLDANRDGALTFDEILRSDLLGSSAAGLLQPWIDNVRADLALGIANEQLPAVQLPAVQGNLLEFLDKIQ